MDNGFDCSKILKLGWRQGAILGTMLSKVASDLAPETVSTSDADWFILTSHDCDIANPSMEKEPVVEVLLAKVTTAKTEPNQYSWGRNPRILEIVVDEGKEKKLLSCAVHARWSVPRDILPREAPKQQLPDKERRLIAEWLAKRYIRAAFPTAFDLRWRGKLKEWSNLLKNHRERLQGVYLRISTNDELPEKKPYQCHLILAVPEAKRRGEAWREVKEELEKEILVFWNQFRPGIECAGVEVLGTDEITLAEIEPYQRFDADWVSFEDDTPRIPVRADMKS